MKRFLNDATRSAHSARDGHVLEWAAEIPENYQKIVEIGDWGMAILTPPGPMGEPGDIRIEYLDTIEAKHNALEFARELHADLLQRLPDISIEFIRSSDHYHLLISDLPMCQARAASRFVRSISMGAISGPGRSSRSSSASVIKHIRHRIAED